MKVINLNSLTNKEIVIYISKLQEKINSGVIKISTEYLLRDIKDGIIEVYIITNKEEVVGWTLLLPKDFYTEIQILEVFRKNRGIGTMLLNTIKLKYSDLIAEALPNAVNFYIKNNFKIKEKYETRVLVEWTR